jgi:hypothetical protein
VNSALDDDLTVQKAGFLVNVRIIGVRRLDARIAGPARSRPCWGGS